MKISTIPFALQIAFFLTVSLLATAQAPYQESVSKIGIDALRPIFSKLNSQAVREQTALAIQTKSDVKRFLKFLIERDDFILADSIRQRLESYNQGQDLPILFIWHPIDTKKMEVKDLTDAKKALKLACDAVTAKQDLYDQLVTTRDELIGDKSANLATVLAKPESQQQLATLNAFIKNTAEELVPLLKDLEEIKVKYALLLPQIEENNDKVENILLNTDNKVWSDYLLSKDQVLVVILGGKNDLANAKIKIDNKPTAFELSLNELKDLATATGILPGSHDAVSPECAAPALVNQSIPIKFMLTRSGKVRAPTTISVSEEKSKLDIKIENHEKVFLTFKVGVAAANIDRKMFTIDSLDKLTIQPDTAQQKEWKSNLMVMLDIYPWGRDIDRLDPIWKKDKRYGMFNLNRIGISVGAKLSKDPLEKIFGGISYAISKELSVNAGLCYNATPKDVKDQPVGINATLDYLKDNAGREYKPAFYFGIALSPAAMGKTLGLIK